MSEGGPCRLPTVRSLLAFPAALFCPCCCAWSSVPAPPAAALRLRCRARKWGQSSCQLLLTSAGAATHSSRSFVSTPAFLPFRFCSPFNRAGTHGTDWGARGNGSRPAVPTMREERKHESHNDPPMRRRYDPANPPPPPDPERWLPKWERSDAKRKHKKKHKERVSPSWSRLLSPSLFSGGVWSRRLYGCMGGQMAGHR